MLIRAAKAITKHHEGCRLEVYLDSRGIPTKGYGHRCEPGAVVGTKITPEEADALFDADYKAAFSAAVGALSRSDARDEAARLQDAWNAGGINSRQAALIDLAFNLGEDGLLGFPKMLRAVRDVDWRLAAEELLLRDPENTARLDLVIDPDRFMTPYAKQVGRRARDNAYRIWKNAEPGR